MLLHEQGNKGKPIMSEIFVDVMPDNTGAKNTTQSKQQRFTNHQAHLFRKNGLLKFTFLWSPDARNSISCSR
jgi:hypothetical protein